MKTVIFVFHEIYPSNFGVVVHNSKEKSSAIKDFMGIGAPSINM